MYLFVLVQERSAYYGGPLNTAVKARIEEASGERCLVVPFEEFDLNVVRQLNPRAVVMSGFGRHFQSYKIESFYGMDEVLHKAELPVLAICGSHQLMGFSFTRDFHRTRALRDQPMRKLKPAEDLPRVPSWSADYDLSEYFVASGFFPVRKVREDPILAGLPQLMIMKCSHYCEVKRLPRGFVLLAGSGHCRIEMMRHAARPLYGTQFHPEQHEAPFLHGRKLLENFARVVDAFWR